MLSILLAIFSLFAHGNFKLPEQLNPQQRVRTMEILGLGTSTKFLSNGYPLGGYDGLEVGVSIESIRVKEITGFGVGSEPTESVYYPKVSIGKGIYNNSDIFINFIPYNETTGLSEYGFQFRWSFYQFSYTPINLSLITHANSVNIGNRLTTRNVGTDLMVGVSFDKSSFFFGGGWAISSGKFSDSAISTTPGLDISSNTKIDSPHYFLGATYKFDPIFVGISLDKYIDPVYSLKLGLVW